MKKLLVGLTLLISISSLAATSDFERGFNTGKKANKGRVVMADGSDFTGRTSNAKYILKHERCADGKLEQVVCTDYDYLSSDYKKMCAGLCLPKE
jgi:hypothetical protein